MQACMDRFGGLVWSLARRVTRSTAEADDAVQEIFVDLWRSASRFDPSIANETTFVAMIARRRLIDRGRRRSVCVFLCQRVCRDGTDDVWEIKQGRARRKNSIHIWYWLRVIFSNMEIPLYSAVDVPTKSRHLDR